MGEQPGGRRFESGLSKATKAGHNCNVYGHLPKEEVVSVQKRLLPTSGEDGSAKRIVWGISNLSAKPSEAPTKHQAVVHHSSKQPQTENKQKSKKKKTGRLCSQKRSLLTMLLRKLAKADILEVEKEEGSSNAGNTVRAQGRAHLPNRFEQRFFGLARPKSACRPFAQIEKFCFPRIVCSQKREVLFWTTQRTLASTFALGCRSKAGIRQGSSCTLK